MPPFPNLISESILVSDTIRYLQAVGGHATAVRIVDRVMKIRKPEPNFARLLVSDLVERDSRLSLDEDIVFYSDENLDHIDLSSADFVVVDLETTGSQAPPSRITEIGAFRVRGGEIVDRFHSLVNPETPIPPFVVELTGISDKMVSDAPKFGEIADDLLRFVGDSIVVAHNASFDLGFLNHEIGRVYKDYRLGNPSLCTVQLSRSLISEIENHKLKTVANYYSIDLVKHHRADHDARATAEILVNLLKEVEALGVSSLGAVRRLGKKKDHVRTSPAAA